MAETNGTSALAKITPMQPAEYSQADFVRWQIVGNDVTKDEFDYFLNVARHLNLDPLRKQIHCVKRGSKAVVQTGIDGYRVIASRTGALAGIDDVEFGPTDKEGHPAWARVTVYRMVAGQRCPFAATARWQEYRQLKNNGELMPNWKNMPFLMLGKCSEALALRKAFPEALSGIYTDAEIGSPEETAPAKATTPAPAPAAPIIPLPEGKTWTGWCAVMAKELGIFDNKDQFQDWIMEVAGRDPRKVKLTVEQWAKVAAKLDEMVAKQHQEGLEEEDAGMAKMAGLDEQTEEAAS